VLEQNDSRLKEKIPPTVMSETFAADKPVIVEKCRKCGEKVEAFYMKVHDCERTD
jgi:hypothetical protein